jgi:hypothetical protein
MAIKKKWLDGTSCDLCGKDAHKIGDHFYDCTTDSGQWGLICQVCFDNQLVRPRVGQKYNSLTLEKVGNLND